MLKAIGTLRLVRPLMASAASVSSTQSSKQLAKCDFHTSAKRLGGGEHEFLVNFLTNKNHFSKFDFYIKKSNNIYVYTNVFKHRDTPENNPNLPFEFTKENKEVNHSKC